MLFTDWQDTFRADTQQGKDCGMPGFIAVIRSGSQQMRPAVPSLPWRIK